MNIEENIQELEDILAPLNGISPYHINVGRWRGLNYSNDEFEYTVWIDGYSKANPDGKGIQIRKTTCMLDYLKHLLKKEVHRILSEQPEIEDKKDQSPQDRLLTVAQIIGGKNPLIATSKSTWWEGVKTGRFPKPIKLGARMTRWRESDILAYIKNIK